MAGPRNPKRRRVVTAASSKRNGDVRRAYTMSAAALEQRRRNAPVALAAGALAGKATGPRTEEGKAAVSRNGWKHGAYSAINRMQFGLGATHIAKLFGKPCVTTCPYHPDNPERQEKPCSLVLDGLTHAGGSCLDKTIYVNALTSLMQAMREGDMDGMQGELAREMASNLQLLNNIREQIANDGVVIKIPLMDKHGAAVIDPETGKPYIADAKAHPVLAHLIRMTEALGINFAELLATPRAREKLRDEDEAADFGARLIGAIAARAGKRVPRTIEGGSQ